MNAIDGSCEPRRLNAELTEIAEVPGSLRFVCLAVRVRCAVVSSWCLSAQQSDIRVTKVRDHFFMLTGAGGNVAALVFPEGITLVDSGRVEMSDKLLAALRTLSTQPVRYIINTSADPDHTGGNEKIGATGGQITGGNVAGQVADAGRRRGDHRARERARAHDGAEREAAPADPHDARARPTTWST